MRQEKALMMALKIVSTCKKYGNEDRCTQCPFNIKGCIVCNNDDIPAEWRAADIITTLNLKMPE